MKRAFTFVVAALWSATALSGQAVTTSKFDVAGIPVIFKPVRANDVVAVRLYLRGGSANLTAANAGIEDLMLESATRGTSKYDKDAFTEKLVVVVVGNVDREDLTKKIAASFGSLPTRGGSAPTLRSLGAITPDVVVVNRELPTNYIAGFFSAPPPSSADYAAMKVATDILSHRLFEEVRTKRNLSYAVSASLDNRASNFGALYVTAVEPDTTLKVMFSEVRRLQREPLSQTDLAEEVNTFLTRFWMAQQSNMGQAQQLGLFELLGGGWQNLDRFTDAVRRVTPADVQRVASQYMQHARFAVIGNPAKIGRPLFTSF